MGIRCADHVAPLYPQKLALNSPTGGGRSVGIVRSRTKATEFFFESELRTRMCQRTALPEQIISIIISVVVVALREQNTQ